MAFESFPEKLEHRKYTVLLASIALLNLIPVLSENPRDARGYGLLWGIVLLAAIHAAAGNRRVTITMALLAVFGYGFRVYTLFTPATVTAENAQDYVEFGQMAWTATFLGFVIFMLLKAIARADRISGDTVAAAICVYLLVGLFWTMLYGMVEIAEPGSFRGPAELTNAAGVLIPEFSFAYYSYVTLTTLGYGDITPVTYRAQTLSWMEAVVGVTFMATAIALLVSQLVVRRRDERDF